MNSILSLLLGFIIIITAVGCNDCHRIRCDPGSEIIHLHFMRTGQNAVFGEDAFIERDSITIIDGNPFQHLYTVLTFNDSLQTVDLNLSPHVSYSLEFHSISIHTLSLNSEMVGMTDCCGIFESVSVTFDGQVVCIRHECDEVLTIEI